MDKVIHQIMDAFPAIVFGMLGGIAKLLLNKETITLKVLLSSLFVSGFVGMITYFLLKPYVGDAYYLSFICSMCGHSAGLVLLVYQKRVESFLERVGGKNEDKL